MNKFLCSMLLSACIAVIGCVGLGSGPSKEIAAIPAGTHESLSFPVELPKRSHSWEIGLWPSADGTLVGDLADKHLIATVTNISNRRLTLTPGVSSVFERRVVLAPGEGIVVSDRLIKSHAQATSLFGCDAQEHGVSFQLNLKFGPSLRIEDEITVRARGRDAL